MILRIRFKENTLFEHPCLRLKSLNSNTRHFSKQIENEAVQIHVSASIAFDNMRFELAAILAQKQKLIIFNFTSFFSGQKSYCCQKTFCANFAAGLTRLRTLSVQQAANNFTPLGKSNFFLEGMFT